MRFALALLIIIFVDGPIAVAQQPEAPFGLIWGASVEEIRGLGIELRENEQRDFGASFLALKLPKALADQEGTFLSFGHDNKLWRVTAVSRLFDNNPHGIEVRSRYNDLSAVLADKYGKGSVVHSLGDSIYREPRYFIAGIRGGESRWFTNFATSQLTIQIGIIGQTTDSARWRIIFEHKELEKTFRGSRRTKEKGAL